MRAVAYFESFCFELGVVGKNAFLKCLSADENGEYNTVHRMTSQIKANLGALTNKDYGLPSTDGGYKDFAGGVAEKIKNVEDGKFFIIVDDFIRDERRYDLVKLLNQGLSLEEAQGKLGWKKRDEQKRKK